MERVIGRMVYRITGDDTHLRNTLNSSARSLQKAGDRFSTLGRRMTLGVTLPIVGIGTALANAAIEAEETRNKFETAFRGIQKEADETRDNLADNYGLAQDEAERLLSSTGDLLKGFGATAGEALNLSDEVQRLSVDLASYNNLAGGSERASNILTKALLGERDALVSLGIKISEADVQQKLLEEGKQDLTGEALLLARAEETLALVYEQSGDALGDYERSQGSARQSTIELKADIRDLSVELGEQLLPFVKELLGVLSNAVSQFSDLETETQKNIIKLAGLAAAIGPLSAGIGGLIKVIGGLKTALAFLGGPLTLAIAGATAGVVALGKAIGNSIDEQRAEDMERFADAAERTGRSVSDIAQDYADAEHALAMQLNMGGDLEEVIRQVAGYHGVALEDVVKIARTLPSVTDEHEDILSALEDEADYMETADNTSKRLEEGALYRATLSRDTADAEEDVTEELEKQNSLAQDTWEEYWSKINEEWEQLGANLPVIRRNLETIKNIEDPDDRERMLEQLARRLDLNAGMLTQAQTFVNTDNARKDILAEINELLGLNNEEQERTVDLVKQTSDKTKEVDINTWRMKQGLEEIPAIWREFFDEAVNMDALLTSTADHLQDAFGGAFEALGKGLIDGQAGAEAMANTVKGLLTGIFDALAQQLMAMAGVAFFGDPMTGGLPNPAKGAAYLAGAAGLKVASGLASQISAFGEGGSFYADEPQLIMVGDKPEHVNIQPVDHAAPAGWSPGGGGQNIIIQGDIYGYEDFAQKVEQASKRATRTGRVGR